MAGICTGMNKFSAGICYFTDENDVLELKNIRSQIFCKNLTLNSDEVFIPYKRCPLIFWVFKGHSY